jgi:hypothetical protein
MESDNDWSGPLIQHSDIKVPLCQSDMIHSIVLVTLVSWNLTTRKAFEWMKFFEEEHPKFL